MDCFGWVSGADGRNRTGDLRITSALLYQLSYIGVTRDSTRIARNGQFGDYLTTLRLGLPFGGGDADFPFERSLVT